MKMIFTFPLECSTAGSQSVRQMKCKFKSHFLLFLSPFFEGLFIWSTLYTALLVRVPIMISFLFCSFPRICWFVMLACSIFGASYLIYQAYKTMEENPIIESPSLTRTPMWEVPFPAVTFCPFVEHGLTSFAFDKTNWPEFAYDLLPDNL